MTSFEISLVLFGLAIGIALYWRGYTDGRKDARGD